jgi:serine/threonine protein kinase/tetratricopeptide (TPR) repeat protein
LTSRPSESGAPDDKAAGDQQPDGAAAATRVRSRPSAMTPEQFREVAEIFRRACEHAPEQRGVFVEQACADRPELRSALVSMLRHDLEPRRTLQSSLGAAVRRAADALRQAGGAAAPERLGAYRILREIGQGGFGVVYLAEQDNPQRTVALKVLRPMLNTPAAVKRFEYEAHILGRLRHPGIAQIFEAGVTDDEHERRRFFAMEYIRGANLLAYADDASRPGGALTARQRLELVLAVCAAVQHAHQNGVVHRDLKPENILVDEQGRPKVVDFGVARVSDADSPLTVVETGAGQLLGTLGYMSPEQLSGDPARVDTRCDVYALGVLLFQLLSGRMPHDLSRRSLPDAIRTICESTPPRLGALRRELRGDLEAIVQRAMEKDVQRRYPSVAQLASDIEACLAGRPVSARPASAVYHLRKLAARHRALLSVAALGAAAVVLGVIGTAWQAYSATRERNLARIEARKSDRINRFLQSMLAAAEPARTRGRDVSVRELLDRAAARVHDELADEPEIEAAVHHTVGDTYAGLGLYEQAEAHLRQALAIRRRLLGDRHAETAATAIGLARVLQTTRGHEEAFELCNAALAANRALLGQDSPEFARGLVLYAGLLPRVRGDVAGAERAYREALEIYARCYGPQNEHSAAALGNLGALLLDYFRFDEAEPVMREAYDMAREALGADHPYTIMNGNNLAVLLAERGRADEAETVVSDALDAAQRIYGPEHPETARLMSQLAGLLLLRGECARAESLARGALDIRRNSLPAGHPHVTIAMTLVADALACAGTRDAARESAELARQAIETFREQGQGEWWFCADAEGVLGLSVALLGDCGEAQERLSDSLERIKRMQGARSRAARTALSRIIRLYETCGEPELAAQWRATLAETPPR